MVGIGLVVRLAAQTLSGTLASDECFHAAVAEWILGHRAIPAELPQFYSGFFYYYQPLLHLLGAAWIALFGTAAWLGLPVVLTAALFALTASGGLGTVPERAGRWAASLLLVHASVTAMAVRLYVEPLITLLFVACVALLFRARASGRWPWSLALGVALGLALLTKLNAWVPWLGVLATAAWDAARGERARAVRLAVAGAIGLAMVAPWLVRNQVLFGSAFYPALAPDLDRELYALNAANFSTPTAAFLGALPRAVGIPILALSVAAFGFAVLRRRWTLRESVMSGAIILLVATAFVPFAAARHLNAPIAVLALLAAGGVAEGLAGRPLARLGTALAVLAVAGAGLATMPDHRTVVNPPAELLAAAGEIAARTPEDAQVLSLWTYDTAYHSRRRATWPNPWGQRSRPIAMFRTEDPDSILAALRAAGITHVLSTTRPVPGPFNSANYPESFVSGLDSLMRADSIRLTWRSPGLVLLDVSPAGGKPANVPPSPPNPRSP